MHQRLRTVISAALMSSLLIQLPGAALGASPTPFPDLTMAPLRTLPPIVRPGPLDASIPSSGYVLGRPDAPVTIEVYEDFQCPYCRRFTAEVKPLLIDAYVRPGTARLVFRDLPFLGEESRWAAVAGRLAAEQDRFWPMHDYLFANQLGENVGSYTPDRLMLMAEAAGLDMETFIAGLQVPAARELFSDIESGAMQAAAALGINATPTVVVNGVPLEAPDFVSVSAAVDAAIAAIASTAPASPTGVMPSPEASTP